MDFLLEALTNWLKEMLVGGIMSNLSGNDLAGQLTEVAGKLAEEYWTEHQQDFFYIVDGSFLEEYDEYNIGVQFKAAATVSITYAWRDRIPYRTGGFEYGYKLHH